MVRNSEYIWLAQDLRARVEVSRDGVEIIAPFCVRVKQIVTADGLLVTFTRRAGSTVPESAGEILARTALKLSEKKVFLDSPSLEIAIQSRACLGKVTVH